MKITQRETIAIANSSEVDKFLGTELFTQFKLNYKQAIALVNESLIVRTCDLLTLLLNYKTDGFVTYHQDQSK